ncbi:sensor histidine kinase [Reichenbachiella ulvae]|uniref:histidine kinase n=1 Tax=Reichenbachiella ulvae TaxID=2980104 RepID=A0ABT3CVQ5_9BACT|nr:PAS domain-containing sensor histidine kinase [Reichenbachiella ulvae]MCV9387646.1 PAS domain-containing sensor histidine kinase [Reichenbachiella ulvae]
MNTVDLLFEQSKKIIEITDQPSLIINAQSAILAANAAFRHYFDDSADFGLLLNDPERLQIQVAMEEMKHDTTELLLTLTYQGKVLSSKWKFQYLKEIDAFVGFGEVYANETASVEEVADLLKSSPTAITDISSHLSANMDKFQLITDHISDVVCLHHPEDARYLYVSPSVKSLVGFEPHEMEGKTPYEFFHPDFIQLLERDHQRSAEGKSEGPPPQMDVMLVTKTGEKIWASVHSEPLFDEKGEVALIISSSRDISKRKLAEQDLMLKNTELNAFSYRISHDLRSPLTSIMGLINLIVHEDNIEKIKEYTGIISSRVDAMDRLIHSIMDYARNMNNRKVIEEVELKELLDSIKRDYRFHPNYGILKVRCEVEESLSVRQDPERLKIIFNCLLSNAYNFLDRNKEESTLDIRLAIKEGELSIEFDDNGIGIKEEIQPQVFDMFYRGTSLSQGAGLGLYLLKQTAKKLDGQVGFTSQEGQGSSFRVQVAV